MDNNPETTMQDWIDDFTMGNPISESWDRRGGKKTDKAIKICPFCDILWEKFWTPRKGAWESYGKGSIPRIGKAKRICPKCKAKRRSK